MIDRDPAQAAVLFEKLAGQCGSDLVTRRIARRLRGVERQEASSNENIENAWDAMGEEESKRVPG